MKEKFGPVNGISSKLEKKLCPSQSSVGLTDPTVRHRVGRISSLGSNR